jgi:rubrerythrin
MLSKIPIILENLGKDDMEKEILRTGVIAELDAITLYEQMAAMAKDRNLKKILLDIAKEEKTHVGEFLTLLLRRDREQEAELEEGKKEVEEVTEK